MADRPSLITSTPITTYTGQAFEIFADSSALYDEQDSEERLRDQALQFAGGDQDLMNKVLETCFELYDALEEDFYWEILRSVPNSYMRDFFLSFPSLEGFREFIQKRQIPMTYETPFVRSGMHDVFMKLVLIIRSKGHQSRSFQPLSAERRSRKQWEHPISPSGERRAVIGPRYSNLDDLYRDDDKENDNETIICLTPAP